MAASQSVRLSASRRSPKCAALRRADTFRVRFTGRWRPWLFYRQAVALIVACLMLTHGAANCQVVPDSHTLDANWPTPDAAKRSGRQQISGVALDNAGRVFVLGRGDNHWMPQTGFQRRKIKHPAVEVFGSGDGKAEDSWGRGVFMMPHQIVVDTSGNVWVVDAGLHQVMKFDASGKRLLVVGGHKVRFNMPTDIAFLSDGAFVVSDGYVNSRIVKFGPDGQAVAAWGTKGTQPLQFQTPHSVAVDDQDRIYVADRENNRIQVLNSDGEHLASWVNVDRPITVRYAAGTLFVLSNLEAEKGIVRKVALDGTVIESFHTKPPTATDDFEWPHGLTVGPDGNDIYVGFTLTGRRVQRYRRTAANKESTSGQQ